MAKKKAKIKHKFGLFIIKMAVCYLNSRYRCCCRPRLRCCCCCCRLALSFKENTHIHIFICMCVCDLENCAAKIKMFNLFHFMHYADADCAAHWRCLHYSPLPSSALLNSLPSPPPPLLLCTLSCAFTFQCTMGISKHFLFTAFIISFRV